MKLRPAVLDTLSVLLFAFVLRAVFVWQWSSLPYALSPFLDAKSYDEWAQAIAQGMWSRGAAFYQSPLYPYLLALVYKMFGHSLILVAWIQAALGAFTCAWIAGITRAHFGRAAGIAAGVLAALDRAMIYYTAPVLKETVMLLSLVGLVHFVLRMTTRERWTDALWAGVFIGTTALLRGNALVLALAVPAVAFVRFGLKGWRPTLIAVAASLVVIAPATWHNWRTSGDFVLINSCGGFNFYTGNWQGATGATAYPPFISTDAAQEEADTRRMAEKEEGRELKPSEVSAFWVRKGREDLTQSPARALRVIAHKIWYFWSDREIPDNYDSEFTRREDGTILSAPMISFGLLAVLGVAGLILAWRTPSARVLAALLGLYLLSAMLFYVTDRYRLPAVIFLLPPAGVTLAELAGAVRKRLWRPLVPALVGAMPVAALAFAPLPSDILISDAFNWGLKATLYSQAGRDAEAVEAIQKALSSDRRQVSSQALIESSTSYERLGRLKESEEMLRLATELHPEDGLAFHNLARFHYEHGDLDGALELYNKALFVAPYIYQPYIGLGVLYLKQGRLPLARESVRRGLVLSPENPQLLQLRQMLEQGM